MGKKNVAQKIFWEDNERFADLFNVVLGKGEMILRPENLVKEETSAFEVIKKENNKTFIEKYRDVIKKATTDMTCFLIGIENQSDINYAMPLRVMLWDALSYQEQIRNLERRHKANGELTPGAEFLSGIKKEDKLKPVCTIVVYYAEKEWDGSRNLHELLDWNGIPEHMRKWIADYPMVLVDVYRFPDWEKFQTDLREVFGFIQNSHDMRKMKYFLEDYAEQFSSMAEDACNLIEEVTGSKKIRRFRREKKERKQNMCKAIDDMMKENYDNGFEEGKKSMCKALDDMMKENYDNGFEEGKKSMCKAMDDMMKENYDNGFEEGQKSMCKAMDDMMKEKYDAGYGEGRKREMINTERERQRAAELERELQLLKEKLSA